MVPEITDIHTHILFGVDDGAVDHEMSLELMRYAYEQGERKIFLTNHSYGMKARKDIYRMHFDELKKDAEILFPGLSVYKGCEILCMKSEMPEIVRCIRNGTFPTMNGTRYVLAEFDPYYCAGISEMDYCLEYVLEAGYIPIIAHVERYGRIYDSPVENLKKLKESGFLAQINLYSVKQDSGTRGNRKELANEFLKNNLVDFVGTDSHRTDYKRPEARIGAEAICQEYGELYAWQVLHENAERMLTG